MAMILENPEWSNNVNLKCKTIVDLPPSCLEFIPRPRKDASIHLRECYNEYFVVGTYCLEKEDNVPEEGADEEAQVSKKPQSKNGSLVLFRYRDNELQIIQTLPHPSAIFDLHFLPSNNSTTSVPIFAIVSSSGDVAIFKIIEIINTDPSDSSLRIQEIATHHVFPSSIAPTYFTWNPEPQSPHEMAIATSSGGVYLVAFPRDLSSFQRLYGSTPIIKHTEYAWCCTFSPPGTRLFSGGDDNQLRVDVLSGEVSWDLIESKEEEGDDSINNNNSLSKNKPVHDAGVTFILYLPHLDPPYESQILLTGSYDDTIRVISQPTSPSPSNPPKVLASLNLGGGVWRLKIISTLLRRRGKIYTILASCMHAGAKILEVTRLEGGEEWEIKVLADMRAHKSMNYASDVQSVGKRTTVVSLSFYDRLVCVWDWDDDRDWRGGSA